jgi:hypothetical protein
MSPVAICGYNLAALSLDLKGMSIMKMLLALAIITVGMTFPLSAQEHSSRPPNPPGNTPARPKPNPVDAGGWAQFRSDSGRFSVLMPEIPEEKAETTDSEHGPYTTHLFIVKDATSVYLIGWVDYDPSFNFNRQAELEANRDNFVKGVNARLLTSRPTVIDGYSALEFTAETEDRVFKSRVFMVGRRPYQLVIGSPKGMDDSVSLNRFFNSFKVSLR